MPQVHSEFAFEEAVEACLVNSGWTKGSPGTYDATIALDPSEVIAFINSTQPKEWKKLIERHGNEVTAKARFLSRLTEEIKSRGTVDVLRNGVADLGVPVSLAYFRPAHSTTPELEEKYSSNRLQVTRQVKYSPKLNNTLDLTFFVNGIPIATAELKNQLTGQSVKNAINQYRYDRDSRDLMLSKRAVVHFAVDPYEVYLTTKLEGAKTKFLPFNQGGSNGGAGNPPTKEGHYATSYLWEEVLARDAWLEILARFIHIEAPTQKTASKRNTSHTVIFPRYHQWDAVRKVTGDVRLHGAGSSYLFEHSPGSGKSNTIAWAAYHLARLHDESNEKIFSKVIVITDRIALDHQLQDTIYQFDHVPGVVEKIDKDSTQLAQSLSSTKAQIVITTLQKFPFVLDKVADLTGKRFAIVIDEAHSSQTGEAQKALKVALGAGHNEAASLDIAEHEDATQEAAYDDQDVLTAAVAKSAASRGRQSHLSYFAFTATPKQRTLELFGTKRVDGTFGPFHYYSMRQAIEEGFILDVLANYTTYKTYWKLAQRGSEDPDVPEREAARAIAKYVSLHPHNLAQKAELIIEHFRRHTRKKIMGRAKAMVVTRSRLHAVRYKQAFDKYLNEKGYDDLRTLVAFSGTVIDPDLGTPFTEVGFNGFPERQLPENFKSDDYQILIVAEKYQTGYDEPLLHTMYVDKKLGGIKAVQTLCRLNRIAEGKDDTFILDFTNRAEEIQESFRPFYDVTIAEPTDPNVIYNAHTKVLEFGVIHEDEADAFANVLLANDLAGGHQSLYASLDPTVVRFGGLDEAQQQEFRQSVSGYVRLYAFLSQTLPWSDAKLESLYLFCRYLLRLLPSVGRGMLDLGDDVELTHLRIRLLGENESLSLSTTEHEEGLIEGITGDGRGPEHESPMSSLSLVITKLNDLFGIDLTESDKILFEQLHAAMVESGPLREQAVANEIENFAHPYNKAFTEIFLDRHLNNEALVRKMLENPEILDGVKRELMPVVYESLRKTGL